MKKIATGAVLFVVLLSLTFGVASAAMDMEDPALCVAGVWLTVDAAKRNAVDVVLPAGTKYGARGGCELPAPGATLHENKVRETAPAHVMLVLVDGRHASTPTVTVTYRGDAKVRHNGGRAKLLFAFHLP